MVIIKWRQIYLGIRLTYGAFREGETADGLPGRTGRLDGRSGISITEVRTLQGVSVYLVQTRVEVEVVHSMIVCRDGLTAGMINDKVIICCRGPPCCFGSKSSV